MHAGRRIFIKGGLALVALMSLPKALLAGAWPQKAFESAVAQEAVTGLFGTDQTTPSGEITLKAPVIAENGAVVPVSVKTSLQGVESISIVVENNPRPLAITFEFPPETLPDVACRIKMGEASKVMAVVKTNDGIFSVTREVKVTIGGCDG
jgi:sulfur-oxidizing protein SoxY